MSNKLVKYGAIQPRVQEPESWVDVEASEVVVPKSAYDALAEQFKVVNFEYNRLSNYWMGFIAERRPTEQELSMFEERGKSIFNLGSRLLVLMKSRKWYHRLFMRIFWWLTGE
jgi:hypothetical protein